MKNLILILIGSIFLAGCMKSVVPKSTLKALVPVAMGQGVPEAADYNPDGPWPHHFVILDESGAPHAWNDKVSSNWLPSMVNDTELVVVVSSERVVEVDIARYTYDHSIYRFRFEMDVQVREAHSGEILIDGTIKGGQPDPPPFVYPKDAKPIYGSHVDFSGLSEWLGKNLWQRLLEGHTSMVTNVIFSPNGQVLASGSIDNSLRLWRTADGEPLQSLLGSPRPMARLAFSPDGKILASERFNIISIWQVETGKLLHEIIQPYESSQNMLSLVFSPNGQILASGSMDNTICLWNVADSELLNTLKGHMGVVTSIVFSPDGQTLASGSGDKTVRLWRVVSGELLYMLEGHTDFVTDVAFSPDGKTLASGSYDDSANLWRVADGKLVHSLKGSADVKDIAFSPDGNILALGSMREIQLWQVADGKQLQTLELERSAPQASRIIFSPNGQFFAWGASDYTVGVWSTSDGNKVSSLVCGGKMISASISPDGILAAGLENGTICLKPIQGFINE